MTDELPDPLVPADVDLRDFPFMPLDVRRLRDSDLAGNASGEAFRAAVLLWCASWHQVPAGSLPNNEQTLAHLCGFGRDAAAWQEIREHAMWGWQLSSDGRLYHAVIAEKAVEAWNAKLERRERVKAAIAAKKAKLEADRATPRPQPEQRDDHRNDERHDQRHVDRYVQQGTETVDRDRDRDSGQGQGQGQGVVKTLPAALARPAAKAKAAKDFTPDQLAARATWDAYCDAYQVRYGVQPVRNATVNSQIIAFVRRVPHAEAPSVAGFYVSHKGARYVAAMHPTNLMLQDAEKLRTEWATGRQVTATSARQSDRTASIGDAVTDYLNDIRGAA